MTVKKYLFFISQNYSFAILRPLQKTIKENGGEVRWFLYGSEINNEFLQRNEVKIESIKAIKEYDPLAVFVPGNTVPSFIPGLKVAVFHGFNSGKLNRRGLEDHFNIRGCFDLYCTQGPNTTEKFQLLAQQHGHFSVVETGWPALDPLFVKTSKADADNRKPMILMCSTFSRNLTCAPILLETIKRLSQSGKWQWKIQFHPKMDAGIVDQYKAIQSEHLTFIETDNVIPLLQEADVMLCDTSSVLIMFLLQGKPVVTFNNISPSDYLLDINQPSQLELALENALSRPKSLMANIERFISETHPKQDGQSAQRVLDAVDSMIDSGKRPAKTKPMNLIRALKMRKELNYWKF
ncbi:CDP-glycerol--glycerophosphate glycerophosphotransferase [Cognaticolwellia beringensis]|uniref:CDP-glycerol--glycerophosphate glycerophosphotransferase n=1 Tax=Cognaticolwellia beringensis TaxID=1967665 RepID=A0A222G9X3_9GAMM|nr:CDP-glycerol--glycerophosphate glycerophosphotransferase [Cognaticolwellia beringensis]ASP48522.1 CDP-glycerol--glycerophosphate glycerophosphotransferase [Cognaticolwellia beringensis]